MLKSVIIRSALLFVACSMALMAHARADASAQLDVAPGELAAALESLSKQVSVDLVYQPQQIKGFSTKGVRGVYTAEAAVRLLLKGTPLELQVDPSGAMLIVPAGTKDSRHSKENGAPASAEDQIHDPSGGASSAREGEKSSSGGFRLAQVAPGENSNAAAVTANASSSAYSASASGNLDEIIVTANKRRENLSSVPASVDVVTSAFLNQISANQLSDYIGYLPNVTLVGNGAPGSARIYIRGITSVGGGSTVGVYIDGAPFGSSTSFASGANLQPDLDPSVLQQIEVLKGPQGTLYGSGSEGGLIKYVTTPPDLSTSHYGFTEEGSTVDHGDQGYAFRAHANVPLIQDSLAVEGNVYYRKDPGFIDNLAAGKADDNDDIARGGYVSLLAVPTPDLKIRLSALYQSLIAYGLDSVPVGAGVSNQTGGVLGPPILGRYTTYLRNKQGSDTTDGLYVASVDYQMPAATLSSTTSFSNIKSVVAYGDSGYDNADYGIDLADTLQNNMIAGTNKETEEVRLSSNSKGRFEWLLGGFFTHESSVQTYEILADTTAGTPDESVSPDGGLYNQTLSTTYSEYSAFANGTLNLWRSLYLTLGGRYSDYDQRYAQTRAGAFGDPQDPGVALPYADTTTHDHAFTYQSDLSWRFESEGTVYVRAASGYRVGGPTVLPPGATPPAGFTGQFGPENLYDYEVGVRRTFLDRRLSLDADAFYIDYLHLQGNRLLGIYVVTGNPGNAASRGVEFSGHARPIPGLTVDAAFGYVDATLSENAPDFSALKGDDLTNSPHFTGSFNVAYEHQLGGDLFGVVSGGVRYVSGSKGDFSSAPDATYFAAQSIIDLRAGLRCRNYTATLYVKNLANTYAYENNTGASTNGPPYVSVTPPRTIGVRFAQEF